MSLLGKLFGGGGGNESSSGGGRDLKTLPPIEPAFSHDFTIDRDRMFNVELTNRVHDLLATPKAERDQKWQDAFFGNLWNASIALPEGDSIFTGPDGFSYLRINIPAEGEFESNSLSNLVGFCLDNGAGAVLFAHPGETDEPAYVMPMGILESLVRFGDWRGDPIDVEEMETEPDGDATRFMTSTPSHEYLSAQAARALDHHLKTRWGISKPRVALMMSDALSPTRALVFNKDNVASQEEFDLFAQSVGWFLPRSRGIMLRPPEIAEREMQPLSSFY